MERGYHDYPDKLRTILQEQIDDAERRGYDRILLGYGLCGNGAEDLRTRTAVLAMPRFDDCIAMMLCIGKRQKRALTQPGIMYLTRGWALNENAMLPSYQGYVEKYGERKAKRLIKVMLGAYTDTAIVDTGCYDLEPVREYAEKCRETLGLGVTEVPGTTRILEKLVTGEWDEDILVFRPGQAVTQSDFCFNGQ